MTNMSGNLAALLSSHGDTANKVVDKKTTIKKGMEIHCVDKELNSQKTGQTKDQKSIFWDILNGQIANPSLTKSTEQKTATLKKGILGLQGDTEKKTSKDKKDSQAENGTVALLPGEIGLDSKEKQPLVLSKPLIQTATAQNNTIVKVQAQQAGFKGSERTEQNQIPIQDNSKKLSMVQGAETKEIKPLSTEMQALVKKGDKNVIEASGAIADVSSQSFSTKKENPIAGISLQNEKGITKFGQDEQQGQKMGSDSQKNELSSGKSKETFAVKAVFLKESVLEQAGNSLHLQSYNTLAGESSLSSGDVSKIAGDKNMPSLDTISLKPTEQLLQHIQNVPKNQPQEIQVTLNPAELGTIKISFRQIGNQVEGLLEIQNPEVRKDIERALPQIAEAISQIGINIRRIDVSPIQNNQQATGQQVQQDFNQADQHHLANQMQKNAYPDYGSSISGENGIGSGEVTLQDKMSRQYFDDKSLNMFA